MYISGIPRPFPPVVSERKTGGEGASLVKSPDFGPFALAKNTKIFWPPGVRKTGGKGRGIPLMVILDRSG